LYALALLTCRKPAESPPSGWRRAAQVTPPYNGGTALYKLCVPIFAKRIFNSMFAAESPQDSHLLWTVRGRAVSLAPLPRLMGIVNITPDSFSDGGRFFDSSAALEHALRLVEDGADIIDVGGESTRPGAVPVATEDELRRVIPLVAQLAKRSPV